MKIKTKKQLNLPQLIEYVWDNDVKGENFPTDQNEEAGIYFATNSDFMMNNADYIRYNNTFTVEVEEEITEDTVIEKLYHTTIPSRIVESGCSTIKSTLEHSTVEPIAFYILNDDLTMTLIWRDGKLVE